mmetsp:Transcript_23675/g.42869  ORF Transcript_23675/g.42869 Transcript_23675/m.42869 type:complete len:433 (+) Transcript_23675:61-1359(+)|eukprot:CAMPEP_0197663574 /NCGR_PEP_ID=MMETSP1338-20131121/57969_1 /TAXON_ID=43686 ORGANISM="Pelagodinium beii, Strain RCC1491" /NCGR_SAMPLE_ID=MMETSP1338 /ASSEMBLY_ACC=CAM_ASM_000754 /LENGTH=432 /DNA_ID=CAMNT_0043242013 /DNA_START=61 /DNA_END=1359 /DNA_ORIENTATION=+
MPTPATWEHFKLLGATSGGMFALGYSQLSVVFCLLVLTDMPTTTQGYVTSACTAGQAVSPLIFGTLSDALGGKTTGVVVTVLSALGNIFCALAGLFWLERDTALILGRFMVGLGIGSEMSIAAKLVKEHSCSSLGEEDMLPYVVRASQLGSFLVSVVFLLICCMGFSSDLAWRLDLGLGAVPAIAAMLLRLGLENKTDVKARSTYMEKIRTGFESRKMQLFSFQVCVLTLSTAVAGIAAAYSYKLCKDMLPAFSSDRAAGIEFAIFSIVQLIFIITGGALTKSFESLSMPAMQTASIAGGAVVLFLGYLLSSSSMALLMLFSACSLSIGAYSVCTFTIAAGILPSECTGTFMSAAAFIVLFVGAGTLAVFPGYLATYGIGPSFACGAIILLAASVISKLLVEPDFEEGEKLPLLNKLPSEAVAPVKLKCQDP